MYTLVEWYTTVSGDVSLAIIEGRIYRHIFIQETAHHVFCELRRSERTLVFLSSSYMDAARYEFMQL